jgi:hypothetical protein
MRPILPGYVSVALDHERSVSWWPRKTSSTAGEWGDREGGHSGVTTLPGIIRAPCGLFYLAMCLWPWTPSDRWVCGLGQPAARPVSGAIGREATAVSKPYHALLERHAAYIAIIQEFSKLYMNTGVQQAIQGACSPLCKVSVGKRCSCLPVYAARPRGGSIS